MAQVKKDEIKKQIMDAALELFATKSYEETTISDVAQKAGISVGNIYRYYRCKLDILRDVVPKEFIVNAKEKLHSKMMTGKNNSISEQIDSEIYLQNSNLFLDEIIVNRLRILAFVKCSKEETYDEYKKEIMEYMVQSFLDGFINDPKEREEKRELITLLYEGIIALCMNVLSSDCDDQTLKMKLSKLIRYHVSGLASLV